MKIKLEITPVETLIISYALRELESSKDTNITDRNIALNLRERIINEASEQITKSHEQRLTEEVE